ncbi:CapA family protein [Cellulomonas timonensis]|uniref:CapA family protein n=1 Tax=Cellulomonas timonensis TaxID=1689271 RepID=UPI0008358926|nr:CapA family protein [Cellulomonas timonensis]
MTRHARTHPAPRQWTLVGLVAAGLGIALAAVALAVPRGPATPVGAIRPVSSASPDAPTPTPSPTADPDAAFTILAAGDVLPHLPVIGSARTSSGSYDFAPLLDPLGTWVRGADLALCHLEVPVAPHGAKPSGYPMFASPAEIAQGLADGGWDGCSTASNHSVDRGFAGVAATLDALDAAALGHVGTARSAWEQSQPQLYVLERAGQRLTVAHLAATYGTNGMPVDADKPWSVDLLDTARLVAQAQAARSAGADLVVASVHCCVEYVTEPTARQTEVAQALADSGVVDLLIGHHAHVPQPVARLEGGPGGDGMWVAYGLGNMLSNQDAECCVAGTESGLLLTAHVTSTGAFPARGIPSGPARVTGVEWTPTTVDRGSGHRLHALIDIPEGTSTLSASEVATRAERVRAAAGTGASERTDPTTPTGPEPLVVIRTDVA